MLLAYPTLWKQVRSQLASQSNLRDLPHIVTKRLTSGSDNDD